jgi:lysozyme-like protein
MPVKGTYLAVAGGGALLIWSGLKGKAWSAVLRNLIAGKKPGAATTAYTITGTPLSTVGSGSGVPGLTSGSLAGAKIPTGKQLSPAQIGALWIAAGGNPFKANVAVCIAMHESSGQVDVLSGNPDGGTNVGLWQLDTPGGKGAGYSIAQLQQPLTNARVAVQGSSNGTDWSAWATAPDCGV